MASSKVEVFGGPEQSEAPRVKLIDLGAALYFASSVGLVWHYGFIDRPIWFDEYLHFVFGSYASVTDVLRKIYTTTAGINHGQTGTYFLLDYWLLKGFGASATALRLPSILSLCFLIFAAYKLLVARGVGSYFTLFALVMLAGQLELMGFSAEARPYMPLAAFSVGVFAYYAMPLPQRATLPSAIFGYVAVLGGVLMHPYFSLYWLAAFLFWFAVAVRNKEVRLNLRDAIAFVNVKLGTVGTVVYFLLAAATWLLRHPNMSRDPWRFVPKDKTLVEYVLNVHLQFAGGPAAGFVLSFLAGAIMLAGLLVTRGTNKLVDRLVPPAGLFLVALSLSMVLALISYLSSYWIMSRQWPASIALVAIAVAWGCAEIWRWLALHYMWLANGFITVCVGGVLLVSIPQVVRYTEDGKKPWGPPHVDRLDPITISKLNANPPANCKAYEADSEWVPLARENIRAGGPVWPVFRTYYEECAW